MLTPPVAPMLAATTTALPEPTALAGGCLYQPKFDGYRALVFHHPSGTVTIQSRSGTNMTNGFPEIVDAVHTFIPPGVILDGELVVWDGAGVTFTALAGRLGATKKAARLATERPASFLAFDLLAVESSDVRRLPLTQRQQLLTAVLADARPPIQMVPTTSDIDLARAWLDDYAHNPALGIEGLVIKAAAGAYESGSRGWLKYRVRQTHDVVVGAVLGPTSAPNRLILGYYQHDQPIHRALRVAGSTVPLGTRQARTIGQLLTPATDEHPWPQEMPSSWLGLWSNKRAAPTVRLTLVQPDLVVEVSSDTAFEHGRWRHQVRFMRTRTDKNPTEVRHPLLGQDG